MPHVVPSLLMRLTIAHVPAKGEPMISTALLISFSGLISCPPNDAGTVVVIGGELEPISLQVPGSVDYRLTYDTSKLALFFDADATQPAPPNTTFESAPATIEHGDLTLDGRVDGSDMQLFVDVLLGNNANPVLIAQADFDENGILDSVDTTLFVTALLSGVSATTSVTLFAQGLAPSAALCDVPVNILTDDDGNGTFVLADTVEVTVVSLELSPVAGSIGTPLTVTLTPAIPPLIFDSTTMAQWTGVYEPLVGPATSSFSVTFSPSDFRESSASQAVIVVGDGTFAECPDVDRFTGGTLVGQLEVNFDGFSIAAPASFTPEHRGQFFTLSYPEDGSGLLPGTPSLGVIADPLFVVDLSDSDGTGLFIETPSFFHYAYVLKIAENSLSTAEAPASIIVDIASLDAAGNEIDRLSEVELLLVPSDGDPASLTYSSDRDLAIVLVNAPVNDSAYPNVLVLETENGGSILLVPCE